MRTELFFLPLVAAMALSGCQSDEPGDSDSNGGNSDQKCGYVAVNIVQPSSTPGSKAAPEGYEYGSNIENYASEATFLIFNEQGKLIQNPQTLPLSGAGEDGQKERIYDAVLVIDGVTTDPTANAKQIICVLNPPTLIKEITYNEANPLTIDGLVAMTAHHNPNPTKVSDNPNDAISGYHGPYISKAEDPGLTFTMSNSVYLSADGQTKFIATQIDNIATTEKLARENPVDIYVERIAAKIVASTPGSETDLGGYAPINDKGATVAIDGVETALSIQLTGIGLVNLPREAYVVKNINTSYDGLELSKWNSFDNNRSFWGNIPSSTTFGHTATRWVETHYENCFEAIADTIYRYDPKEPTAQLPENTTYQAIIPRTWYVNPNTTSDETKQTAVLVTAKLVNPDTKMPVDLAFFRGGYTTSDEAKKIVAAYLKENSYCKKLSDGSYVPLEPGDLKWYSKHAIKSGKSGFYNDNIPDLTGLENYEALVQLNVSDYWIWDNQTPCKVVTNADGSKSYTEVNTSDVNKFLTSQPVQKYKARIFADGDCYYYAYIDHSAVVGKTTNSLHGVVRNHVYRLTLESIEGIGTPICDPDDPIIPERTKDDTSSFYLAARVNVLAWKLATQTVQFQGNN